MTSPRHGEGHQFESGQAHYLYIIQISWSIKEASKIKKVFYPKLFFPLLFIGMLVLGFFIAKPFLPAIFMGIILAYFSYPYYKKLTKKIKNVRIASLLVCMALMLVITIPLILVLGTVTGEALSIYQSLETGNTTTSTLGTNFLKIACKESDWISCKTANYFVSRLPDKDLNKYIHNIIEKITEFFIENGKIFIATLPSILVGFFVMFFVIYYLLIDGEKIYWKIRDILPLKGSHKDHVFERFNEIIWAVFYGNLSVAFIQGLVGMLGLFVLGVDSPILWGFVMMVFALIPYIGTAIVWLPAALNLIFKGYLENSNSYTIKGIILIIYGVLVISTIDNILKPKIIGSKANVHPVLVLIGILGGLNLFGFVGIILGPAILALIVAFFEIYEDERSELEKYF